MSPASFSEIHLERNVQSLIPSLANLSIFDHVDFAPSGIFAMFFLLLISSSRSQFFVDCGEINDCDRQNVVCIFFSDRYSSLCRHTIAPLSLSLLYLQMDQLAQTQHIIDLGALGRVHLVHDTKDMLLNPVTLTNKRFRVLLTATSLHILEFLQQRFSWSLIFIKFGIINHQQLTIHFCQRRNIRFFLLILFERFLLTGTAWRV